MTSMDYMGREHSGNGLYTTKTQSEPEVHLAMKDEGTFLFPPARYDSMASYANFWANVPISDGVLSNIILGYADLVRQQASSESVRWGHRYDAVNEKELHHSSEARKSAAKAAREVAYNAHMADFYRAHPVRIKADFARAVARAGQAAYFATALTAEETEEVRLSTVTVGDTEMSLREVTALYQLGEIRENFQDPEVTAAERLEDLRVELRQMRM